MTATIEIIRSEIAALKSQIESLDLPGKIARESRAIAAHDKFKLERLNAMRVESVCIELLQLSGELNKATHDRIGGESDISRTNRDIDYLNNLLTADDRINQASTVIDATQAELDSAQAKVDSAQAAQIEVTRLVDDAIQTLNDDKKHAASAVLEQIKSGKTGKLPLVNRDRLDMLELAQQAGDAELVDAQQALAQCVSALDEAKAVRLSAMADVTKRVLHLLARDYAGAMMNHKLATNASNDYFDTPDLDALLGDLKRAAGVE